MNPQSMPYPRSFVRNSTHFGLCKCSNKYLKCIVSDAHGCDRNSSISQLLVFFITLSRTDFVLEGHSRRHPQTNLCLDCTSQTARLPDFQISCKNFKYICIDVQYWLDGASDKDPTCQCRRHKRCGFNPWVGKIPWRRKWQLTPVFLQG